LAAVGNQVGRAPAPSSRRRAVATRNLLVACLALNSGATDALGFVALGGAFTSVMTGNLVLLGLSGPERDGALAARVGAAILLYIAGCAVGARIAGAADEADGLWPAGVSRGLAAEAVIVVVNAGLWWLHDGHPAGGIQLVMLALNALALGIQSSSVQRFGVSGLSTTYLTGTLTSLVAHFTHRRPASKMALSGLILVSFVVGAIASAALIAYAPEFAPCIPIVSLGLVLTASRPVSRMDRAQQASPVSVG
jgi:uncharacterized membrane protein YoaK (UPF0700 family)